MIAVVIVSLVSLVGVFTLSIKEEILRKYIFIFISIAIGALLGDAFIHLIPEALEESLNTTLTSVFIVAGIILFFILEKFMHWHHHGEDKDENTAHPICKIVLLSDGIHNFIDGIIIAASFMVSVPVGIATTLAVILHEIPQEVGDFAVLLHFGYTRKRALLLNFLSALAAVLGAVFMFIFANIAEITTTFFLPIAAGGFIYIAVADLIPELHKTKDVKHSALQLFGIALGVLAMIALALLE